MFDPKKLTTDQIVALATLGYEALRHEAKPYLKHVNDLDACLYWDAFAAAKDAQPAGSEVE